MNDSFHLIHQDFLLSNEHAVRLYHDFAKNQPIIDYHNHLPPGEIARNIKFNNLTDIWLKGDHYKWRAMRALGIDEMYITGKGSDREKFIKWAQCVPKLIRNPLFHWTHLELFSYFNIDTLLCGDSADYIYDRACELLKGDDFSTQSLLHKMKVEVVCTTDDPADDLRFHRQFMGQNKDIRMLPAFRPDRYLDTRNDAYLDDLKELEVSAGVGIKDLDSLLSALEKRVDFFDSQGCVLSDHGLNCLDPVEWNYKDANKAFKRRLQGIIPAQAESSLILNFVMHNLGKIYNAHNWTMQLHLGAMRNTRSRMYTHLGKDSGFDSIGNYEQVKGLQRMLDALDNSGELPKTIVYNLNPADNHAICSLVNNFNEGPGSGKMQYGSAWWFLDQKDGMEAQLNVLSNLGILSTFVGMLTDSRSFMSFPRHEYFRRVLCNLLGKDMAVGLLPCDYDWIGGIVSDICYNNARSYFDF